MSGDQVRLGGDHAGGKSGFLGSRLVGGIAFRDGLSRQGFGAPTGDGGVTPCTRQSLALIGEGLALHRQAQAE